jgi:hypothetical protein
MMDPATENAGAETGLVVELILPERPVRIGEETPAEIRLTNHGTQVIRVNGRLSMAYPDTDDRELYCLIRDETGEEYTDYRGFQLDYRRKPLEREHFPFLNPGEGLEKTFDLQEWYRLIRPGTYKVLVVYHPEEHDLLSNAERNPIHSAPVSILVTE